MRRISTAFAAISICVIASPTFAQQDTGAGFGALVGGLIGGALGAAASGRAPRPADFVPGGGLVGGSKGKAGGIGQRKEAAGSTMGGHKGAQSSVGATGQLRKKAGK